ncbi:MAG: hypothetical protein AAGL98_08820, partial [Planctomycetota bacterium]
GFGFEGFGAGFFVEGDEADFVGVVEDGLGDGASEFDFEPGGKAHELVMHTIRQLRSSGHQADEPGGVPPDDSHPVFTHLAGM